MSWSRPTPIHATCMYPNVSALTADPEHIRNVFDVSGTPTSPCISPNSRSSYPAPTAPPNTIHNPYMYPNKDLPLPGPTATRIAQCLVPENDQFLVKPAVSPRLHPYGTRSHTRPIIFQTDSSCTHVLYIYINKVASTPGPVATRIAQCLVVNPYMFLVKLPFSPRNHRYGTRSHTRPIYFQTDSCCTHVL